MTASPRQRSPWDGSSAEADEARGTNEYYDRTFGMDASKILPGEYYVTDRPMVLVTVLGSCVAACIRDPGCGIGGMNHFMLPDGGGDPDSPASSSARYGMFAMELLINELIKLGARKKFLEAKIFGGGNVMREFATCNVGERNAQFAVQYLKTEGIPVRAQDLGDVWPRKVYFFPEDGRVKVKKLRTMHNRTILDRESAYGQQLRGTTVGGDIELFG